MVNQLLGEYYWSNLRERIDELFGSNKTIEADIYDDSVFDGLFYRISLGGSATGYYAVTFTKEEFFTIINDHLAESFDYYYRLSHLTRLNDPNLWSDTMMQEYDWYGKELYKLTRNVTNIDKMMLAHRVTSNEEFENLRDMQESIHRSLEALND